MAKSLTAQCDKLTRVFSKLVADGAVADHEGPLSLGVDLGTANIVLAVVDSQNQPVAGATKRSSVVRDGIVVDWPGAVRYVRELKDELEARLGQSLTSANVAIPPGVGKGTIRVFENVAEAAELDIDEIVDEPVAAARLLGIHDGCVIDIGHGTTGISVMKNREVVLSVDEATGGHHVSLVLAGALNIDEAAAEKIKVMPSKATQVGTMVRPTLEKMASIANNALNTMEEDCGPVFLVGGSAMLPIAVKVFEQVLERPVHRPRHPLWVTPLGLAMSEGGIDG